MEDSIIKIKLVLEDKSEKQTDISVPSSCLNINDDFVEQLFGMKFTDNKIINCNIVLAANNLAVNIENYIKEDYKQYNPKTTFIAYGADTEKSKLNDNDTTLLKWYKEKGIKEKEYYLFVGRFVPENNYETMVTEFMKSNTKKDFVLITNVEQNKFYEKLKEKTGFGKDSRIKFVGTVYDQELLKKIRENAYGYFHGHEVGGTNPSLLEALATTDLNLLLDVGFNKEVAEDSALYFSKEDGMLANLIDNELKEDEIKELGNKARKRINSEYTWNKIVDKYEKLLLNYS